MTEDRRTVVARAWGLAAPARCQEPHETQERISPRDDPADDKAVIQNQDLEHQREMHVPKQLDR